MNNSMFMARDDIRIKELNGSMHHIHRRVNKREQKQIRKGMWLNTTMQRVLDCVVPK